MDYNKILQEIWEEVQPSWGEGHVADYIPELGNVPGDKFGIHLVCMTGEEFSLGDHTEKFSIQSISKVFSLMLAMSLFGEKIWKRVGVEPSGNPFNSLVQLEYERGIPRNPLINSGAIVVADILLSHLDNPKYDLLEFVRKIAGTRDIHYNEKVAYSEKEWGFRNVALANFLKSFNNINNDVEAVLDFYFHQCALEMTCRELANAFLLFANHGRFRSNGEQILSSSKIKRINAIMLTCGFYDEAGDFAFKVGLAGKSGVGGGIAAIHPNEYSIAVWSPRLNGKGNSVLGLKTLELLTTKTGMSIF